MISSFVFLFFLELNLFWGYAKHKLQKFKGFKKENFYKNLKECEWRFNHKHEPIDKQINLILNLIKSRN